MVNKYDTQSFYTNKIDNLENTNYYYMVYFMFDKFTSQLRVSQPFKQQLYNCMSYKVFVQTLPHILNDFLQKEDKIPSKNSRPMQKMLI